MRQLFYFFACALVLFLTSCSSNEEELWIEADGSGRYESTMDLSGIYPFLLMGLNSETEEEGEEEDPFTLMLKNMIQSGSVDTVINFASIIEKDLKEDGRSIEMLMDSLKAINPEEMGITEEEKQSNIQMVKDLTGLQLRMQINQSGPLFKITTINNFDDISAFKKGGNFMETLMSMSGRESMGGQQAMVEDVLGSQTQFSLDGGTLKVTRRGQDMGDMSAEDKQQMQMVEGMLGNEPYRLTIHFPGKVKKRLDSKYATVVDNQTVLIEIPQEELKKPELEFDLGIKFKGLK